MEDNHNIAKQEGIDLIALERRVAALEQKPNPTLIRDMLIRDMLIRIESLEREIGWLQSEEFGGAVRRG
jgi:hypothetical protein